MIEINRTITVLLDKKNKVVICKAERDNNIADITKDEVVFPGNADDFYENDDLVAVKLPVPHLTDEYIPFLIKNGGKEVVIETQYDFMYRLAIENNGYPDSAFLNIDTDIKNFHKDVSKRYDSKVIKGKEFYYIPKFIETIPKEKVKFKESHFETHGVSMLKYKDLDVIAQGNLLKVSTPRKEKIFEINRKDMYIPFIFDELKIKGDEFLNVYKVLLSNLYNFDVLLKNGKYEVIYIDGISMIAWIDKENDKFSFSIESDTYNKFDINEFLEKIYNNLDVIEKQIDIIKKLKKLNKSMPYSEELLKEIKNYLYTFYDVENDKILSKIENILKEKIERESKKRQTTKIKR